MAEGVVKVKETKKYLTDKVEANTLWSNELGVSFGNGMGAVEYPNPIGC